MNQKELSFWLKILILISALLGFLICFTVAPQIGKKLVLTEPTLEYMYIPTLVFIWVGCIPIYLSFYQAWKLFTNIEQDNSFSEDTVNRLRCITKLAVIEILLFIFALITLIFLNLFHPTIYIVIFIALFVAIFVTMCCAVISHLVSKAIILKKENDLTI